MTPEKELTSTERVLNAVRDLRALDQIAMRETVAELTGLKLSVVDDRLRTLTDDGQLKRLMRGVYEVVHTYDPPRVMSRTILEDGSVKYDIGDTVLTLTPSEDRRLAELGAGALQTATTIHSTKEHLFLATQLAARVDKMQRLLDAIKHQMDERQRSLFDDAVQDATN